MRQTSEKMHRAADQFKIWIKQHINNPDMLGSISSNPAKINLLRCIHVLHEVLSIDALICGTEIIAAGFVPYQNTSETFEYFVSIGMNPTHAKLMTEADGQMNFVFTRSGINFLIANNPDFKSLMQTYKFCRNETL